MARGPVGRALARLEPPPRLVDWSILLLVVFEVGSGLLSFTVGTPDGALVFYAHGVAGLTLAALLVFKFRRVRHRVTDSRHWDRVTAVSVLAAALAVGALATGVAWTLGVSPELPLWTLLNVHIGLGLALLPLALVHLAGRFRLPRRVDFEDRRTALKYTGLLAGGATVWWLQGALNRALDTAGADRRFTGSQPTEGTGNDAFPVTSWVADDPDPVDPAAWSLSVRGLVREELELALADVDGRENLEALLDCTSGWYTTQEWGGVRVGDLLERAGAREEARYVRFVSVTGYRWSLPVEEARAALLATRVGGERLRHGHGAPLRLVAPGRRGFQWVKWVERVEVRRGPDPAQWVVTLVSGFDD